VIPQWRQRARLIRAEYRFLEAGVFPPDAGGIVMRNSRRLGALAVTAVLVVPLVVFGAPALASSVQSSSAQYEYGTTKVIVCHHTNSTHHPWVKITVSMAGWLNGHSRHSGDFLVTGAAACPPLANNAVTTTTSEHGNSANHGNNGHHGKP
jgi:hypothetical protein